MFIQIASDPPTSTSKDALIELERSMPSEKEFSELLAKADEKVFGLLKRQSKTRNLCIAGASSKQPGYFNLEFYNVPEKDIRNLAD